MINNPITYRHNTLNPESCIDYIFSSDSLYYNVLDVLIQDSGLNLSDHIPIIMKVNGNVLGVNDSVKEKRQNSLKNEVINIRWDKSDLSRYYEYTGANLYPVFIECSNFITRTNVSNYAEVINALYNKVINALLCSDVVVHRAKPSFFKKWWDPSLILSSCLCLLCAFCLHSVLKKILTYLDHFKNKSIENYKLWQSVGKPQNGEIFQKMKQSKQDYKESINKHKKDCELKFGENLYESLLDKDMNNF